MTLPGIFNKCCPCNTTSHPNKQEGQDNTRYSIWHCNSPIFGPVFEGSVNQGLNDIIHPPQFYGASNKHAPLENDLITHMHMVEEGFTEINASENHEHNDDAFAEYEHVETSWHNVSSNVNAEASESIGA